MKELPVTVEVGKKTLNERMQHIVSVKTCTANVKGRIHEKQWQLLFADKINIFI